MNSGGCDRIYAEIVGAEDGLFCKRGSERRIGGEL